MPKLKSYLIWLVSISLLLTSMLLFQIQPSFLFSTFDTEVLEREIQDIIDASVNEQEQLLNSNDCWHLSPSLDLKQEYVVFAKDSALFWTTSKIDFENLSLVKNSGIYRLASRIYLVSVLNKGEKTLYSLLPLKKDFEFENSFLENTVSQRIHLPANYSPSSVKTDYKLELSISGEKQVLHFQQIKPNQISKNWKLSIISLFFLSIFLISLLIWRTLKMISHWHVVWRSSIALGLFLAIRLFLLSDTIIPFAWDFELFMPFDFANNWIPSLGMLAVNILWLSALLLVIQDLWSDRPWKLNLFQSILAQVVTLASFFLTAFAVQNIITNSTSNFINFDGVLMRYQDILLLLLLGVFFLTIVRFLSLIIRRTEIEARRFWKLSLLSFYLPAAIVIFLIDWHWIYLLLLQLLGCVLVMLKIKERINQQAYKLMQVLLVSVFMVLVLYNYSYNKELVNRSLHLDNYQTENNRLAEYLLSQLDEKLVSDSTLLGMVYRLPESEELVYNHIKMQHLIGYWSQYQSDITICGSSSDFKVSNNISSCEDFFNEKLDAASKKVSKSNFVTIQDFGVDNYLAKYSFIIEKDSSLIDLYIFLKPKEQHRNLGYPSILVSREIDKESDARFYSYAKYVKGVLVSHKGQYNYASSYNFENKDEGRYTVEDSDYMHLIDKQADDTYNIITARKQTLWDFFIVLSYVFILYVVALYIGEILMLSLQLKWRFTFSLKDKLRLSFIGVLLLTFIVLAIAIIYRSTTLSDQRLENVLEEKMQSVLVELKHKLSTEDSIDDYDKDYLNYLLIKFSNVFFTDINLYDLKGQLVASSRPEVFEKGLIGNRMNPDAFFNIHQEKKSRFIHRERIGKQEYLSAYIPFKDEKNRLIACLNLPYFAKDKEVKADITKLITAFLNLFVILFLITGVFTVFISNRITLPLSFIQNKLKEFRLEQKNEPIQYESKDEIGDLVDEYNRTVMELNENMALLAQKEREGAWKEMAKQIAHEIKNPLTPMKLSLQHLKYIWKDQQREDKEEKMYDTIDMVVKQIDQLAEIASAFSDFSKMTIAQQEEFDIASLIDEQVGLYSTKAQIKFEKAEGIDSMIFADEKQMVRVVQNILSNAIQAVPDDREAIVSILVTADENTVNIDFCDNGSGMDEKTQKRLFEPNFTTKTSGMGLGLAIVKQIVENNSGQISFITEINKGTCFTLKLPKSI